MKKEILYAKNAEKELNAFSRPVQKRFESYIEILEEEGKLEFPEARKVSKNLFEVRVFENGAYRGFYAYVMESSIVLLHFFQKKTQKTPPKDIKLTQQRLKHYE